MEILIKGFIASKKAELFSDCADRYEINLEKHKYAISDGVSKSFFPKFWAEILVKGYVNSENEEVSDKDIENYQEEWKEEVDSFIDSNSNVKWFTLNAYNRNTPALATFVGLQILEKEKKWKATARGDSFLFFVPKEMKNFDNDCIKLSSKQDCIFDNYPDYLSSVGGSHKGEYQRVEKELKEGTFYLMTDALSEWFIKEKENAIGKIEVWTNQEDFEHFVNEERISEKLGDDDSAILIIDVKDDNNDGISYPEKDSNISKIDQLISKQEASCEKTKTSEIPQKKIGTKVTTENKETETEEKGKTQKSDFSKIKKDNIPSKSDITNKF